MNYLLLLVWCYFYIVSCQNIIINHVKGLVRCENSFVPDIKVKLFENGLVYDTKLADTTTIADGSFSMELGVSIDVYQNIFIRVEYTYDKGTSRSFSIENDFKAMRSEDFYQNDLQVRLDTQGNSNFNDLKLNSVHCQPFILFRQCLIDYENETHQTHPAPMLHIVTDSMLTAGLPYASTDIIRIPKDTMITKDIAKHEFAHTVRHSLDGSFLHFMLDVVQFVYSQTHWCDKKTNEGFAFNEGFAELWQADSSCPNLAHNGYDYEGNVVEGLRKLAKKCHNGNWKKPFVIVLKENPGIIHSFETFLQYHQAKFGCTL